MESASTDFLSLLAYAHLRNGKADKAVAALEGLQVLRPRDGWISRSLAYAYLLAQDYNRALAEADRCQRAHGADGRLQLIRSRALFALGRRDEAAAAIAKMSGNLRGFDGGRPS